MSKNGSDCSGFEGMGETALVVEDMADQREIAVEMLNALGYLAQAVENGEAAVEHVHKNAVDVILLDMNLGLGMNGLETFRRIRLINPDQKAVLATGYADNDIVFTAQKLGISTCLKKPFTIPELARALRIALDDKSSGHPAKGIFKMP